MNYAAKKKSLCLEYLFKVSGFLILLIIVLACNLSQISDTSKPENKKPETTGNKETGGIEKVETLSQSNKNSKNAVNSSEDLKKKVCQKYDACGCQDYEECTAEAENLNYEDAVWECMLNSGCESLCAGKPDACPGEGNNPKTAAPDVPNCSGTTCSRDSDCPGGCHGGCSEGRCYLF